MAEEMELPHFATESEEADWWFTHQDQVAAQFEQAAAAGTLATGSAARYARERAAGSLTAALETTIRLLAEDLARAQELASRRGMPYENYLETLLHEALNAEAERLAS